MGGTMTSLNGALLGRLAKRHLRRLGRDPAADRYDHRELRDLADCADWPTLNMASLQVFENEFGRLMMLALLIAAPVIMVLYVIDADSVSSTASRSSSTSSPSRSRSRAGRRTFLLLLLVPALAQAVVGELGGPQRHRACGDRGAGAMTDDPLAPDPDEEARLRELMRLLRKADARRRANRRN
ncbi:hypothetical protein DdX_21860 [Ditylenchus destructor]|uniref:Uncharacterized protein n=1 Tax=Ditylenchus destructor TaxID=166010 RepID=A0AAD4QVA9_9BILA|nr:hypothetical protein DdX_21860 [Ditylenchus destructor]